MSRCSFKRKTFIRSRDSPSVLCCADYNNHQLRHFPTIDCEEQEAMSMDLSMFSLVVVVVELVFLIVELRMAPECRAVHHSEMQPLASSNCKTESNFFS